MTTRPRLTAPHVALAIAVLVGGCSAPAPNPTALSPGGSSASPTAASTTPPAGSTTPPGPPRVRSGPSRASLIQEAVDAGRIDPVSALIYRAQSALNLPGLPDEFLGGPPLRDDGVLTSMVKLMPQLSPEDQARLLPYVARPTDPQSIFYEAPQAVTGMSVGSSHVPAACATWVDSGDLDARFKVWACADFDPAAAEIDIATVISMLAEIWDPMTAAAPAGMGPPKGDTTAPDTRGQHGGDGRIDFYLLDLGQIIYRDTDNNEIAEDAAAMAIATDPFANSTASGFVLLNRYRLGTTEMKLDVIHEFFHVLQFAHNVDAPFDAPAHWFVEASATWSEVFFDPPHSEFPHTWFADFQKSGAGLESANPDHTYAAYIWPFFMQQEKDGGVVFNAWSAIRGIRNGSADAVSEAISDQLSFEDNFREFAVRNLNIENTLTEAGVETYESQDGHFWENSSPRHMVSATILPGSPYFSAPGGAPPLAAEYYSFDVAENARDVTVSILNKSPADQVDGDALVHVQGSGWERRRLSGGLLKFCRDDPRDDIDSVILIVSNHGREAPLLGQVEASAKDRCSEDAIVLRGTIRGTGTETPNHVNTVVDQTLGEIEVTMDVTITITPDDWTSTGSATVTGEYTGDCRYEDSDSGQMTPRGMHIFDPPDPNDMIAYVEVFSHDPRFTERPLTGLYLSVFGRTADTGGTCGHIVGPVQDAFPALQVSLSGCSFFEILNNDGTWHGQCTQETDINPGTGRPYSTQHWTANLEQVSPRPTH